MSPSYCYIGFSGLDDDRVHDDNAHGDDDEGDGGVEIGLYIFC